MEELRTYWEVPAVAHFCSLFRAVFKLIDFDIEDFEEALIVDTESAAEGGRSSLIVDVLTALLRGCLGRRDVTLLNYNHFLYDLLSHRWVKAGFGNNPLGEYRDRACFHILPLYAKVKILHYLCEWRLERPDVELLTKDLNGDSLRVVPLGHDQKGATYWYFYGTRLYREDPVVLPKASKKSKKSPDGKKASSGHRRGKRKRRQRNYDFGSTKKSKSPKKRHRSRSTSVDSLAGSGNEKKRAKLEETTARDDEISRDMDTPNQHNQDQDDDEEDGVDEERFTSTIRHWKPKLEPDLPTENASGSSSFPATPASAIVMNTGVSSTQQDDSRTSFNDIIKRIYSRDDDEEEEESEKRSNSNFATTLLDPPTSQSTPAVKIEGDQDESATISKSTTEQQQMDGMDNGEITIDLKRPHIPDGPPPWDQPELRPADPDIRGWFLVCLTMEDWQKMADAFEKPKGKSESDLHEVLTRDFLPAMKDLFDLKEKERIAKVAELAPRRQSDRLEVKRLHKEREEKIFAERERVELDRLAKVDEERNRRVEQEKREQRVRLRELEREKRNLIKERAREERSRRLELRQKRQQLIAEGKEIPEDLLNATGGANSTNDQELNELDIEIELEHMYGQLEKLLDQVKESEDAEPFLEAVKEEIAPDYYQVIEKPMDFTKMEDKLLYREYKNKAEFVEDVNLIMLNCLQYNGLQSDYTKIATRLERIFIKAWKKFFPPADLEDSGEDARQEELHCISLLGALDKKIKDDVARAEMEEKNKLSVDKKELARQRKRESDRRRRRLKAEAKRAQQVADKDTLALQSLSSLTSPLNEDGTPRRQSLPAPFLVGRTNMRRPPPTTIPARGPGGRFLPAALREHAMVAARQQRPEESPGARPSGGLTTYMPGVSSVSQFQQFKGPPVAKRLLFGQPVGQNARLISSSSTQGMAPITVHSSGATTAKVIRVSDAGIFSNQTKDQPSSSASATPGIVVSDGSGKGPNMVAKRELATYSPGGTYLLNTGDGGARLVRLVPAQQDGQQLTTSGLTTSRLIPPRTNLQPNSALTPTPIRTSTPNVNNIAMASSTTSTPTGPKPPAKEGVVTLSSKNLMVSIKDKLAYFTKKDETTGEMKTVGPVDKDTLVRKLAIYQQQGGENSGASTSTAVTPKPVCSVAPVRQPPQQLQATTNPNLVSATSIPLVRPLLGGQPKPGTYATQSTPGQTVLVSSGSQQFVLLPSHQPQVITIAGGSYILTSNQAGTSQNTTPIYLATSGNTSGQESSGNTTTTETAGVQLIQVMPQIILNSSPAQGQLVQRQTSQQQVVQISTTATTASDGASAEVKETEDP